MEGQKRVQVGLERCLNTPLSRDNDEWLQITYETTSSTYSTTSSRANKMVMGTKATNMPPCPQLYLPLSFSFLNIAHALTHEKLMSKLITQLFPRQVRFPCCFSEQSSAVQPWLSDAFLVPEANVEIQE